MTMKTRGWCVVEGFVLLLVDENPYHNQSRRLGHKRTKQRAGFDAILLVYG